METIEKILEAKSHDAKCILNRAGNVSLSSKVLEDIESDGVTSEYLETLGVPVFKYQTQITIHGIFPELQGHGIINGYKHIFQNKNMSLGVKYDAIDAAKKDRIYRLIEELSDFSRFHNCSEYSLSKYYYIKTVEEARQKAAEIKAEYAHIDSSLYFGSFGINLLRDQYGRILIEKYLIITAIYEKNVEPFIENVLRMTMAETKVKIKKKRMAEEAATALRNEKWEAEKEAQRLLEKPYHEQAKHYLSDLGYQYQTKLIAEGLETVKYSVSVDRNEIVYQFSYFHKTKTQKQFRETRKSYFNEMPENIKLIPDYNDWKIAYSKVSAWIK